MNKINIFGLFYHFEKYVCNKYNNIRINYLI